MVCADCTIMFFQNPAKIGLIMASLLLSITSFLILRMKKGLSANQKIALIYAHIFGLIFPIFFYIFFNGCSALFSSCGTAKATFYLIIITGITAAILGAVIAPILFLRSHRQRSAEIKKGAYALFLWKKAEEMQIKKPKLYLLKSAKPVAFSSSFLGNSIFLSVGMADILTKKEIEAVLLHELAHIKNSSSKLKFSASFIELLSPASHIASFRNEMSKEEKEADNFAVKSQKTSRFLNSVKSKLIEYEQARGG